MLKILVINKINDKKKIEDLENNIRFLKKELESKNLAILRIERALETGEGMNQDEKQKPVLTLADMEFTLFGIEEKLKKHNDLLKSLVVSTVGMNDLLEQVRESSKNSLTDMQALIETASNAYQEILAGYISSLRTEFLLVLRDFREKYPEVEEIAQNESMQKLEKFNYRNIKKTKAVWTPPQQQALEELELMFDNSLQEKLGEINKSVLLLLSKTKELNIRIKENSIKKDPQIEI